MPAEGGEDVENAIEALERLPAEVGDAEWGDCPTTSDTTEAPYGVTTSPICTSVRG